MATLKLTLRTDKKPKADGSYPVHLRITHNRKIRYLSTSIYIEEKYWNDKGEVRRSHPNHTALNNFLKSYKMDAETKLLGLQINNKHLSTSQIKAEIDGKSREDFFIFTDTYTQELKDSGQYWEWKKYRVLVEKVRGFHKEPVLLFSQIDLDFLDRFYHWLKTIRKNKTNTAVKEMSRLHRVIREARKKGLVSNDPFEFFKPEKRKPTYKPKLTLSQLKAIQKLELDPYSWHGLAQNVFLFSFFTEGMRFGDICTLKKEEVGGGKIRYTMNKTGKVKELILTKQALDIIEKYKKQPGPFVFPLLSTNKDYSDPIFLKRQISSKNQLTNRALESVTKQAELPENLTVTMHVARHTYADLARTSGMKLYDISKSLGHSSLKVTETYLKELDAQSEDKALNSFYNSI